MRRINTSLYVEETMIQRADRLAIVTGMTRSEVLRLAMESGMCFLEDRRSEPLKDFARLAGRFGMTPLELAARMTQDGLHYRLVRAMDNYPETEGAPAA